MTVQKYAGDKVTTLSSDTKPTNMPDGATLYETDTKKIYIRTGGAWVQTDANNTTYVNGKTEDNLNVNSALYSNGSSTNTFTVGTGTYFVSNGNVGIGNTSPSHKLSVNGTGYFNGNVTVLTNTFTLGTSSSTANGYTYLPNGLILQWGSVTANTTAGNVTFPIAFPTACFSVTATSGSAPDDVLNINQLNFAYILSSNTTVARVRAANNSTGVTVNWLAIGD